MWFLQSYNVLLLTYIIFSYVLILFSFFFFAVQIIFFPAENGINCSSVQTLPFLIPYSAIHLILLTPNVSKTEQGTYGSIFRACAVDTGRLLP